MTRSYTLDNWDGHLSKFESHKLPQALRGQAFSPPLQDSTLPASATGDLQRPVIFSPNYKASLVEGSINYGRSKSHQSSVSYIDIPFPSSTLMRSCQDDASNNRPGNIIPHPFEKKPLFDFSDFSDTVISVVFIN